MQKTDGKKKRVAPKCLCPANCDDIYDGKIMDKSTERCNAKPFAVLHTPGYQINGWPICKGHIGFFTIQSIGSKIVKGRFSMSSKVQLPIQEEKVKETA